MSSSQASWESVFPALLALAFNTIIQPSGRVFSYNPRLRTYLRSSPIVCIFDCVLILMRFFTYTWKTRSPCIAAKRVMAIRRENLDAVESRGFQQCEQVGFVRVIVFLLSVGTQFVKLMACKGLPMTQAWGCFYFALFLIVEVMDRLEKYATEEPDLSPGNPLEKCDKRLCRIDRILGGVAVLLQLAVLAYVDLAGIPLNAAHKRWMFRLLRLIGHFVSVFIYIPFIMFHSADWQKSRTRRNRSIILPFLIVYIILTVLLRLNYRYSHMYFMWSIVISFFSWLLCSFDATRKRILLCAPAPEIKLKKRGDEETGDEEGEAEKNKDWQNVLVFDFFVRILCFSIFWYAVYYNPAETYKPGWANHLG